jgi:hypothetical protein
VVNPASGNELSDIFTFSAQQWSDPDIPLTYQFGFESATSLSNMAIVSKSEFSYASSTLPAGRSDEGLRVKCILQVFDSLSAVTDQRTPVVVRPVSVQAKSSSLLQLLRSSTGSVDSAKNIISVVSSAINSANCSAVVNCTDMHRGACLKTSGECGPCQPDFIGDDGDRSTVCIPAMYAMLNGTDTACATAADCLDWQLCDLSTQTCTAPSKSCSRNCSGHGECRFVSRVTGDLLSGCKVNSLNCETVCSCVEGYSGAACELDAVVLQQRREVRSNLIDSLSNLTGIEDVNAQSVSAWSASLYSLSIRPYELSVNDVKKIASIANTTLQRAIELGVDSFADIAGVLQATDTSAFLLKYNYNPNDYNDANFEVARDYVNNTASAIIQVVSTFADLISKNMVLGQNRTALYYDNFRMSVDVGSVSSSADSITLTNPQSVLERLVATPPSTVTLHPSSEFAGAATVAMKLVTVFPRSYTPDTSRFLSNPLTLQVQAQGDSNASSYDLLSTIEFTFQNNEEQQRFLSEEGVNFTTVCTQRNHTLRFTYICPDSGHAFVHNCSRGPSTQTSFCPRPAPTCSRLNSNTAEMSIPRSCTVTSFNATYTTCSCSLGLASRPAQQNLRGGRYENATAVHSRGLMDTTENQIMDDSGATDMATATYYIASDFADTLSTAGDFSSPSDAAQVIIVIVMLGMIWVPGLVAIGIDRFAPKHAKVSKTKEVELQDARTSVLSYVDNVIPRVFTGRLSLVNQVWAELLEHHQFFQLFTKSNQSRRVETICKSLTVFTFMLFLVAAFFDVSTPNDDGTCGDHDSRKSCVKRKLPFDSTQEYCRWTDDPTDGEANCSYKEQVLTVTAMFYLTLVTTVLTSVANSPLEYCFDIIGAPITKGADLPKSAGVSEAVVLGMRRASSATLSLGGRVSSLAAGVVSQSKRHWNVRASVREATSERVFAARELPEELEEVSNAARQSIAILACNAQALVLQQGMKSQSQRARTMRYQVAQSAERASLKNDRIDDSAIRPAFVATDNNGGDGGSNTSSVDECAAPLIGEILQQRLLMNDAAEETQVFDAQWGLQTSPSRNGAHHGMNFTRGALQCIAEEVEHAQSESQRVVEALSDYSVHHAGLEILHLFMVDLLGRRTGAAKVYQQKFGEEFKHSKAVFIVQKYVAVTALLCLNAFFAYYIMLKALQKGYRWQVQYLACSIVQFGVELLIFETAECVWLNYFVPAFFRTEVTAAAEKLRRHTHKVASPVHEQWEETQDIKRPQTFFLNAPPHMFVSVKVARTLPRLLESMIVGCYAHHLPGEVCRTWPHYQQHLKSKEPVVTDGPVRTRWVESITRGMLLAMQAFVTIPYLYQRVVIRFLQPMLFSGVSVVWLMAKQNRVSLIAVAVTSLVCSVYVLRYLYLSRNRPVQTVSAITPSIVEKAPKDAVSTFIEYDMEQEKNESITSDSRSGISISISSSSTDDSNSGEDAPIRVVQKPYARNPKILPHSAASKAVTEAIAARNNRAGDVSENGDGPLHLPAGAHMRYPCASRDCSVSDAVPTSIEYDSDSDEASGCDETESSSGSESSGDSESSDGSGDRSSDGTSSDDSCIDEEDISKQSNFGNGMESGMDAKNGDGRTNNSFRYSEESNRSNNSSSSSSSSSGEENSSNSSEEEAERVFDAPNAGRSVPGGVRQRLESYYSADELSIALSSSSNGHSHLSREQGSTGSGDEDGSSSASSAASSHWTVSDL